MKCRHCKALLENVFLDLGYAPHSNGYLNASELQAPEQYFPLKLYVCGHCWLVQTIDYSKSNELFTKDYAYFSSVSSTWVQHAKEYVAMISKQLRLDGSSFVIEVASNDGYLLKNFVETGIPCLGIEPTESTANAARAIGIPVIGEFFGHDCAIRLVKDGNLADLIICNNVFAHVPDINDFTLGLKTALRKDGTITLEFPHLLNLIRFNQFDTVYHEHFSYLSAHAVQTIFEKAGLRVFDIEKIPTHGGSIRVFGCHQEDSRQPSLALTEVLNEERSFGLVTVAPYAGFQARTNQIKNDLLRFLLKADEEGKTVGAYGAAAKGNTLLNYAGIKPDLIRFVCDAALAKQGKFMPGSHIPILTPDALQELRPDYVLILPWNISGEIIRDHESIRSWGGQFVRAIPRLEIIE
jgi:hypothetical protein